jgi:hypothetical protein
MMIGLGSISNRCRIGILRWASWSCALVDFLRFSSRAPVLQDLPVANAGFSEP